MSAAIIELNDVSHCYTKSQSKQTQPLYIEHLRVEAGQKLFLHGHSGCGKSTLLNLLSGVLTPQSGVIEILGQDLVKMSGAKRDAFRAKNIGVVFQTFNLIPYLSVSKNIELAVYFSKAKGFAKALKKEDVSDRAKQLLSSLQLDESILNRKVSQLSIGQQQRVAIVRALINQPQLLLVDEPTSALDRVAADAFMTMLLDMVNKLKTTLVFVSHDMSIAQHFSQTIEMAELAKPEDGIKSDVSSKVAKETV